LLTHLLLVLGQHRDRVGVLDAEDLAGSGQSKGGKK